MKTRSAFSKSIILSLNGVNKFGTELRYPWINAFPNGLLSSSGTLLYWVQIQLCELNFQK